jgi:hypothetical protein
MHLTLHPLSVAGLVIIAAGLAVYGGGIVAAVLRVGRQYSSAMTGRGSMRVGAALTAAGRQWPLLLVIAAGVALVVLGR